VIPLLAPAVDADELLRHLTRAALDEELYTPEARDGARAMLQQLPGWRDVYLPALARRDPDWRPRRSADPDMNAEQLRRLARLRGMEAL
jgi:hypothetical protein